MKGWRVRMPHTFRVRVLDPIPPERVASSEARELAGRTEALMKEAHGRMLSEGK
jgi:1-acyl-sn-glycerol-3-phosphate acyltransferase